VAPDANVGLSAASSGPLDAVLARILTWADREDGVRVVVVTSTRARAEGPPDELSDYDVIVALEDVNRFDDAAAYGTPAARWGDEHDVHGTTSFFRGVVYDDGVKVDWTLWPAHVPELVAQRGLTDDLDVGYRVLLDKDGATTRWSQPTYRAHIPHRPTEAEYVALVEEFWWSATYVAKARAREEQFFLRYVLDVDLTHGVLRRMLEWLIESGRGWKWRPGAYGRGIERELRPDFADELAATHGSFERTVALFRRAAREVGESLGYAYPQYADDVVSAYIDRLPRRKS
jgi:aminoglycoside 6-adenylyltransferase